MLATAGPQLDVPLIMGQIKLIVILTMLTLIAAPGEGWRAAISGMLAAIVAAGLVDAVVLRVREHEWQFPSGAVLTAMIVAMVLSVQQPWMVVAAVSVFGVLTSGLRMAFGPGATPIQGVRIQHSTVAYIDYEWSVRLAGAERREAPIGRASDCETGRGFLALSHGHTDMFPLLMTPR